MAPSVDRNTERAKREQQKAEGDDERAGLWSNELISRTLSARTVPFPKFREPQSAGSFAVLLLIREQLPDALSPPASTHR